METEYDKVDLQCVEELLEESGESLESLGWTEEEVYKLLQLGF